MWLSRIASVSMDRNPSSYTHILSPFCSLANMMSRSLFALTIAVVLPFLTTPIHAESQDQPNVLFIFTDDLGWGDLGVFYQNESKHVRKHYTPNLDQLAEEGIQLRSHYCPAPVCAPSRASLLTGVHQGHAEVRNNQFDKALANNHTLASVLRSAGYRTAIIGKYGLQGEGKDPTTWPAYPTKRGFDDFFGYVQHRAGHLHYPNDPWPLANKGHKGTVELWDNNNEISGQLSGCYTTDLFTAKTKHWITEHCRKSPEIPFFVYLAFDTPHAALQVPSCAYPEGRGLSGGVQWLGQPGNMINTVNGTVDSYRHPEYANKGWSDVQERFAGMVRRIDDCVGDLVKTLKDLGIDEQTLIVFTNDNGPHKESYLDGIEYSPESFQSYGPFEGIKRDVYEGGIRMPTLARWPKKIKAGSIDHHPSQFHDWLPTLADVAGITPPARTDGVSLVPWLTGIGHKRESEIYIEYQQTGRTPSYGDFDERKRNKRRGEMQVVHLDGFKGVRTNISSHNDPFELYELESDPAERTNLAGTDQVPVGLQQRMKDHVMRIRRPNESAKRPYDNVPIPSLDVDQLGLSLEPGLTRKSFRGDFSYVPDVRSLQSAGVSYVNQLKGDSVEADAVEFSGYLEVPETAVYRFTFESSTRGMIRIHRAILIDADFNYVPSKTLSSEAYLEKGMHPISITLLTRKSQTSPTHTYQIDLQWSSNNTGMKQVKNFKTQK